MKHNKAIVVLFLVVPLFIFGQQYITIEEIFNGTFRTRKMDEFQVMKHTNHYTVLNFDRKIGHVQIDLYDFATLKKEMTILDTKNHKNLPPFSSYSFSPDEKQILLACHSIPIYRHSFVADYFLYDLEKKTVTQLFDYKIQEPTFSPDGSKIAYAGGNNLFVYDLQTKETTQITWDGKKNHIINGITDWVYEEEFTFVKAFDWNKSGDWIAYIKFDETEVPEFSMDVYGTALYPKQNVFKYPKAGEKNATVSLHLFDIKTKNTKTVTLGSYTDFYIPRIQWTTDPNLLSIQVLNRHQNNWDLLFVDVISGNTKMVLNQTDKAYIDITDDLTFLKDNSFIITSEKSGYNQIYHYNKDGKLLNQITKGNQEVTAFYGIDEKTRTLFYQSVENNGINREVYKIKLDGKNKVKLSKEVGTNEAFFSPNFEYYINMYSAVTKPTQYTLHSTKDAKQLQVIVANDQVLELLEKYNLPQKEFFVLTTEKGHQLNAWMIKPKDFDPNKKYPVLMYQYSGPGSQEVVNKWYNSNDYWYMMLSQQGYIIACVDGRGTGYKGADFKKVTYKELGKYEVEDQIDAAKVIGNYSYVDKNRIGIWGWSYGAFMSSNCLLKGNDIFSMAIAVAPVTNWRFYDTIYTERYMQTPQENSKGYDTNSPINHVEKLKGKYLLIHGSADDNVHVQNTMRMMEALIQAGKQFESQIYPDKNHGIYGGKTRIQLYTKMTHFIQTNL